MFLKNMMANFCSRHDIQLSGSIEERLDQVILMTGVILCPGMFKSPHLPKLVFGNMGFDGGRVTCPLVGQSLEHYDTEHNQCYIFFWSRFPKC